MDAEALATRLHAGQVDKAGAPYIEHLRAVAAILVRRWPDAPQHAVDAAWLHDALEDTPADPQELRSLGVSAEAVRIVQALSRPADVPYLQWIGGLAASGDEWAIKVKLADNEHNRDPARALPGSDMVATRYEPARQVLEAALGGNRQAGS